MDTNQIMTDTESEFLSILTGYKNDVSRLFGINQLCVEAIKTIFDYWFIQYEFPNENGRPYKSSNGEMEYNKNLDKEIPKGWEVCQLVDKCSILLGGTPDTSVEEYWNGDIPWLSSGEIAQFPIRVSEKNITELGMNKSATSFAEKGSILLSITRYIRASILAVDACFNQSVVAIKSNEELPTVFLYPFVESKIPLYMSLRTGAQQPHINKGTVEETWIAVPPKRVMDSYLKYTEVVYADILKTTKEQAMKIMVSDFEMPGLLNKN